MPFRLAELWNPLGEADWEQPRGHQGQAVHAWAHTAAEQDHTPEPLLLQMKLVQAAESSTRHHSKEL